MEFSGGLRELYLVNLWLRTASRVVVRVGEVRSRDFPDLFRMAVRLPWGRFLRSETRVRVRASSHGSRLQHTGRIGRTVAAAIDRSLGREVGPDDGPEQLVLVRFDQDRCLFSVDSSGELLHRRGYRRETAHAPLRETLAAAILLKLGWDGRTALIDPMCGSGTFVIEGALLAGNRPPGMHRVFAFMLWPRYRQGLWEALLAEAGRGIREPAAALIGADLDPLAVAAAYRNAGRAAVAEGITFLEQDLGRLRLPDGPGLILTNPPYGDRIGRGEDLAGVFRGLGILAARARPAWQTAFLCPDPSLAAAAGEGFVRLAELSNGGISVGLFVAGRKGEGFGKFP